MTHSFPTQRSSDLLTDRVFLGNPQIRGFDIRGIGPRVKRYYLQSQTNPDGSITYVRGEGNNNVSDDALGGKAYYLARAEMEIPLGSGARELGLRPSIFAEIGRASCRERVCQYV